MKSTIKKHIENLKSEQSKKPKVIGTYLDKKYGVEVKVYAGPNDKPYPRMPVGDGK